MPRYRRDVEESLVQIAADVADCRACPRLVAWREQVATDKRAAYREDEYWGRGVPGFGDDQARIVVVGLAPAAHGANRTGRMFTGDRSGDFLYAGLHRAGFATASTSRHRGDGLQLRDCWITSAVRCAPPANRPTADERDACAPYLMTELELLPVQVILALGGFAWDVAVHLLTAPSPRPRFGHGAQTRLQAPDGVGAVRLVGSYHPSQQNTFTGRLTAAMLDDVLTSVRTIIDGAVLDGNGPPG